MKYSCSLLNQKLEIAIFSSFDKVDEDRLLRDLPGYGIFKEAKVTLYGVDTISIALIDWFLKHKAKVFVTKRELFSYLHSLDVDTRIIKKFTMKRFVNYDRANPIKALALAGLAGSGEKIKTIIKNIPKGDMTVFIVQHVVEDKPNLFGDILANETEWKVVTPKQNCKVEPGTIYVAPEAKHMKIKNGMILLSDEDALNFAKPSIEILFESLANEYGENLYAALLCGYGDDGIKALGKLKEKGSFVGILNPTECEADTLVKAAIKTKNFTKVVTLNLLISSVLELLGENKTEQIKYLLNDIYEVYGYDFRDYQIDSIQRRIDNFISSNGGCDSYASMHYYILYDQNLFKELFIQWTIHVSEFFRDPAVYSAIRDNRLEEYKNQSNIKIWSAGCSYGEEAYSVAIMLYEADMLDYSTIYATDIDPFSIKCAKRAIFPLSALDKARENYNKFGGIGKFDFYIEKYENYFKMKPFLEKKILFFDHTLTAKGILNQFSIIFCRNVMIYFGKKLKEQVFSLFHRSLEDNGIVVLGKDEMATGNNAMLFESFKYKSILKKAG